MILTDDDIRGAIESGQIEITPFDDKQIQPASIDLRVGGQGITTTSKAVINVEDKGFFELRPGDFGIVLTLEKMRFDDSHTARIGLRSKYARKGIIATTGPQVDPGFNGRLKIGITNLSPHIASFPYQDDLITLEIHQLTKPCAKPYNGPYQNDDALSPEDITVVTEGDNIGFSRMLESLQSISRNVGELTKRVDQFTSQNEVIRQQNSHILWAVGMGAAFIGLLVIFK